MKLARAAHCAQPARFDVIFRDACRHELTAVAFHQIDMGSVVQIRTFGEKLLELDSYLGSDFETARADSGTNGRPQVDWTCAKLTRHRRNGTRGNLSHGAAPSRVDCPNFAPYGIDQENGKTVGCADADEGTGVFRNERISPI